MRKFIYAIGTAIFLTMFIFTAATSLTNPFYGVDKEVLAEQVSNKVTDECPLPIGYCLPTGCEISGYVQIGSGAPAQWWWQYSGCNSHCKPGGRNCCFELYASGCQ